MEILIFPALQDNYIYVLRDHAGESGDVSVAVIDPAVAGTLIVDFERRGWLVGAIFNTHHHFDHTGGNHELKSRYRCPVIGSRAEVSRIAKLDTLVEDGDRLEFGGEIITVIGTPGHTIGHLAYYLARTGAVFCGDALFSIGCGRLFEGTAAQMWQSLLRLRALPGETLVYCAHEYTLSNARFALSIDGENLALRAMVETAHR
ncbi:MAG: hydroxyacylglutathione hydrolase, partial [Rhodospirillaceae bacterium]